MKPVREMSVAEFGAFVASHLRVRDIDVVLTGGRCVAIYSSNKYTSFDLDFIGGRGAERKWGTYPCRLPCTDSCEEPVLLRLENINCLLKKGEYVISIKIDECEAL
jgi:hypothetical protein